MSLTRRRFLWLALIASLAFNAGVGATVGVRAYQQVSDPDGRRHRPGGCRLTEELNLTPEQAESVAAARVEMMDGLRGLRGQLREVRQALTELMTAAEPDRDAIAEQIGRIASLDEQKHHRLVAHFLDIKQLLNPDQQEAFNETIRRGMSRHGRRHGGFGGPGHHGRRAAHGNGKPVHSDDDSDSLEPMEEQ